MSKLVFLVFADLHYKKKMYPIEVRHLEKILKRAKDENVDLVIHEGDFCNDYNGSPEICNTLLNNKYELPVFGVYGNHELETQSNNMQTITPKLTNRISDCIFGTKSEKIEDGSIGYYYHDINEYRLIFLDTNYSLMPDGVTYEHNHEASWGSPNGNSLACSLGPEQLQWLEDILTDAAKRGLSCIVNAHASFSDIWSSSPDAEKVRALYKAANQKHPGTVIMSLNGHLHKNHIKVIDDILYFDVNVVLNGWWQSQEFHPYREEDPEKPKYTFQFTDYDESGNPKESFAFPYSRLRQGSRTLFFKEPLSAIVTVDDKKISIEGASTEWVYDIRSPIRDGTEPKISNYP